MYFFSLPTFGCVEASPDDVSEAAVVGGRQTGTLLWRRIILNDFRATGQQMKLVRLKIERTLGVRNG